jgi:hypothetical protein
MQASELPVLKSGLTWRIDGDKAALIRGGKVLGTVEVSRGNTVYMAFGARDLLGQLGIEVAA